MSFMYEKSATWRWIVASSKASKAFYATFAGVCLVVPWMLGHAVMSTTNRSQLELNEELRRRARDDSLVLLQRFSLCKILENIRSFLFISSSSSSFLLQEFCLLTDPPAKLPCAKVDMLGFWLQEVCFWVAVEGLMRRSGSH